VSERPMIIPTMALHSLDSVTTVRRLVAVLCFPRRSARTRRRRCSSSMPPTDDTSQTWGTFLANHLGNLAFTSTVTSPKGLMSA
jgi:hypothetical protein